MSKRTPIPVVVTADKSLSDFAALVKVTLDQLTGQQRNIPRMVPLAATATTAQIIDRVNEIATRLQGDQ